ncbi:MAG: TIGR00725 family protein [Candidatus Helarchaeota archaeon]|nr:TIGR00725 family protein [Candidatus Helarchaeota archaeon]
MTQIGVIGSGILEDESIYKIAYEVGREIALNNFILICGGKGGVMEAVCKGVKDANGISVGILPSIDKNEANDFVTIKIPTNLGEDRNYIVVQSSEIVICIAGQVGTKIEADYTLKLKKPLITIPRTGGISLEITKKRPKSVYPVNNPKEAIQKVLKLI